MKKEEAQGLIGSGKALDLLKRSLQPDAEKNYFIVLGRFEAGGDNNDEDSNWTPLAIHKTAGMDFRHDGTAVSQGGARVISQQSAGDGGFAFQGSPNTSLAGIWLWGAD